MEAYSHPDSIYARSLWSAELQNWLKIGLFGLLLVYWITVFIGTHIPIPPGTIPKGSDKILHFLAYTSLGGLLLSVRATVGDFGWRSVFGRWIVLAVYGAFDEFSQQYVRRHPDFADWYADLAGAAFGLSVVFAANRVIRQLLVISSD